MTNKAEDASDVAKRLKSIVDYVRDCQMRVGKGEIMDLQGLDKNVIDICDAIAKLPEDEGQALEEQMSDLIDSLETLGKMLKEQQDKFGITAESK
jgi:hypothetical protein